MANASLPHRELHQALVVMPRSSRLVHPVPATVMSAVLPGLGQLVSGRRRRGLLLMAPVLLLAVGSFTILRIGRSQLAGWVVSPDILWIVVAINLAILAWRLFAVVDAYWVSRADRPLSDTAGGIVAGAFAAVVLFTAVPHLLVGSFSLRTIGLLNTVFQTDSAPMAAGPEAPDPTVPPTVLSARVTQPAPAEVTVPSVATTQPSPSTTLEGSLVAGIVPLAVEPEPSLIAPPAGAPLEERLDRLTILLAGADLGGARRGFRTDAIMVASLDLVNTKAVLFGLPRNMSWVPLPSWMEDVFDEECKCFPEILGHLYVRTKDWTNTFRDEVDPGMAALREVVENILGIQIDNYVLVDMRGFVRLVDALGGVTINATTSLWDRVSPIYDGEEWIEVTVRPGQNHLNGREALAYVRSRYGSSDYNRMARQRCVLSALATEADPLTVLTRFERIADAVERSTITDIRLALLPELARVATQLGEGDIATVGFAPNYYVSEWIEGRWAPDVERIRRTVRLMLRGDYEAPSVNSGVVTECGG